MAKRGRPSISYDDFVSIWEALVEKGQESINAVQQDLGGSKSMIAAFRERYEQGNEAKMRALIADIELPDVLMKAVVRIKTKEITLLEKENIQLKTRIDENLIQFKESEHSLFAMKAVLEDAQAAKEVLELNFEKKLAATNARLNDMNERERQAVERTDVLRSQLSQAEQIAAVANKEAEMLREQIKKLNGAG